METPWLLRLNLFQALEFLRQVAVKDQAQEILETYTLSQFSFSPERPSAMWERFLADYKYIQFDGIIKVHRN